MQTPPQYWKPQLFQKVKKPSFFLVRSICSMGQPATFLCKHWFYNRNQASGHRIRYLRLEHLRLGFPDAIGHCFLILARPLACEDEKHMVWRFGRESLSAQTDFFCRL